MSAVRRIAKYIGIGSLLVLMVLPPPLAKAETATVTDPALATPAPLPVDKNDIIISALEYTNGNGFGAIELANSSDKFISLDGAVLTLAHAALDVEAPTHECSIMLHGTMRPKARLLYSNETSTVAAETTYRFGGCETSLDSDYDKTIELRYASAIERIDMPHEQAGVWERKALTSSAARTGIFLTDFKQNNKYAWLGQALYTPPAIVPLEIVEILPTTNKICSQEQFIGLKVGCREYVKIHNISDGETVDLSGFRIRYGTPGSGTSVRLGGVLAPGEYATLYESLDRKPLNFSTDAAVWFEDMLQVQSYPSSLVYTGADLAANIGKSWALIDDAWQWAIPSPDLADNTPLQPIMADPAATVTLLVPCKDGQYRSEETGRCRNIALAGSTLTPCKDGQYRSEETNRCRSIAKTVAAELKPCAEDQFRNPETGRCKKIASTEDILEPCKPGYERNPETNRCRKVLLTSMPAAPFPVEPVKQIAGSTAMWWTLGGIGFAAIAYGTWEWRSEIGRILRRALGTVSFTGR